MTGTTEIKEITKDNSFEDIMFNALLDAHSDIHDEGKAFDYGLENWKSLNINSKKNFDWVFGRESRLPAYLTAHIRSDEGFEGKIAQMEDLVQ